MIHLRTTTLEKFRTVLETSYGSEEELLDYIKSGQTGQPNWKMACGTSWHTLLAMNDAEGFGQRIEEGGFEFANEDLQAARKHVGPGLCEVSAKQRFEVGKEVVEIDGTCDRIRGLVIRDAKCKFSPVDPMDYAASLQWKIYTLLFGTEVFVYDLFSFADPRDGYCELKAIDSFRFWRYAGLENEVRDWIRRFVQWASDRNLLPFLQRKREYAR